MQRAIVLVLLAAVTGAGGWARPNLSGERRSQDPTVTAQEIEKLPVVTSRPRINFQRALKIAENYGKKRMINLRSYSLVEGRILPRKNDEEPHWYFRWVNDKASVVEIVVSLQGSAELLSRAK